MFMTGHTLLTGAENSLLTGPQRLRVMAAVGTNLTISADGVRHVATLLETTDRLRRLNAALEIALVAARIRADRAERTIIGWQSVIFGLCMAAAAFGLLAHITAALARAGWL